MTVARAQALVGAVVIGLAFAMLAACSSHQDGCDYQGHHHTIGEVFPDDCNTCTCSEQGVACSLVACPPHPDGNPASCAADEACPNGPSCGGYCCNAGEHCENDACRCGSNAGCGSGGTCGGPVMSGGGGPCGTLCCPKGKPCPL